MKTIGLIELPAIKLVDRHGRNWTALRRREPLVSKQVLIPQLRSCGYEPHLINLKDGDEEYAFGQVSWRGLTLTKVLIGRRLELPAKAMDAWGVTINYIQEREPACDLIRQIKAGGGKVIVGGSDAFAEPQPYLAAGADAVVRDKSGAANAPILDHVLGLPARFPLAGATLADGRTFAPAQRRMSPQDWPLPDDDTVRRCLGVDYWETALPQPLTPIGSVMADIGCDRKCDFCETPLYKLGYRAMTPDRTIEWFAAQKRAGAESVICPSDQFLGRVLSKGGRQEVLDIMQGIRDLDMVVLWGNGLELKKATVGRSLPDSDLRPDEELVDAVWGWDGRVGCYQGYLPAERPTFGREDYAKLLPWREHVDLVKAVVRCGIPDITYGVIVGLPEDSHDSMLGLESAIVELLDELLAINPRLVFNVTPYAIRPLPGTPQAQRIRESGLLRFEDPAIIGGFWTACADTRHMTYEEVSDWQTRLAAIGNAGLMQWQDITGPLTDARLPA